jgi:hypothetical protein
MLKNAAAGFYKGNVKIRVDFALRSLDEKRDQFAGERQKVWGERG